MKVFFNSLESNPIFVPILNEYDHQIAFQDFVLSKHPFAKEKMAYNKKIASKKKKHTRMKK